MKLTINFWRLKMLKNDYLYGKDVEIPEIDPLVIARRIELLDENLTEIMNIAPLKRNQNQANAIIKAISFWNGFQKQKDL